MNFASPNADDTVDKGEAAFSLSGLDDLKKNVIDSNLKIPSLHDMESSDVVADDLVAAPEAPTTTTQDRDIVDEIVSTGLDESVSEELAHFEDVDDVLEAATPGSTALVEDDSIMLDDGLVPEAPSDNVDMSKIAIESNDEPSEAPVFDFGEEEQVKTLSFSEKINKILHINIEGHSFLYYVVSLVVILLSSLVAFSFYYMERYVFHSTTPRDDRDPAASAVIEKVDHYRSMLASFGLGNPKSVPVRIIDIASNKNDMDSILSNDDLSYVQKYDAFGSYIDLYEREIPFLHQQYVASQEELSAYPFFPSILQSVIDPSTETSLQRSLLSLEAVKFRTALAVFSKFDTFIRQFSLSSGRSTDEVREFLQLLISRGDRDLDAYLSMCYLNPYENIESCDRFGDFATSYIFDGESDVVDSRFFVDLMAFMEDKLENSVLPSLDLSFSEFDPKEKKLSVSIAINTLPDDILQLFQSGIINPHVHVVGHMINFLRQSRFVLSDDINIKELQIEKVVVPVGTREVTVSTSRFDFVLPLQKTTQREITDFFLDIDDVGGILSSVASGSVDVLTGGDELLSGDVLLDDAPLSGDVLLDDAPLVIDDPLMSSGVNISPDSSF